MQHAFERLSDWRHARARAGRFVLALDFDGTLAPIVPRPEDAAILDAARDALTRVLHRGDTVVAVVSGRGLEDARRRVALGEVYYAGNHGMEIDGPGLHQVHPVAAAARDAVAASAGSLAEALADLEGVQVEDKGLTLSVHYRRATSPDAESRVRRAVEDVCAAEPRLRYTHGKMIVEVRPAVDWDKGRATRFILDALTDRGAALPAAFIGDDRTDEDAFRAVLEERDVAVRDAVVVADHPLSDTAATCWLRSPEEVAELIVRLG